MKNSTIFKMLLAAAAALFLFTIIFQRTTNQSEYDNQSVSLVVEPFPQTQDLSHDTDTAPSQNIPTQEDSETADRTYEFNDGFDLADGLFSADLCLEQIKDFQEKVENEAKQQQESDQNNSAAETDTDDYAASRFPAKAVIIDTDFASDADDVVAIRLAMCLQDAGLLDIKGIALSTTYSRSPRALHALCYQDGYGSIPVAMDTSGNGVQVHTEYVEVMYDMPQSRSDYEQTVAMYRRILSESDAKVNLITLGFLQNIQALMNSKPDQYSPLTGMELISQKVHTLYITGGSQTGKPSFNFYWSGDKVMNAARDVADHFPAKIVFLESSLSDDTFCGQFYQTKDPNRNDIVTKALFANDQYGGVVAWDVFSVWCAAQDINGSLDSAFLELEQGTQYISHTGSTQWTSESNGRHYKMNKHMQGSYYSQIMNDILLDKYSRKENGNL